MKECIDCEKDISNRGNRAVRCSDCQQRYRQKYNQIIQDSLQNRYDLRKGSRSPFKIDGEGCGKNKSGKYPRKKQVWMHYWIDGWGEPMDIYFKERQKAIDKLNNTINNTKDITIKPRSREEVYQGWEY